MTNRPVSSTQDSYVTQRDLTWSRSEKAIAHEAFDAALNRELQEVMQEAKQTASKGREAQELWDMEHYLTERRQGDRPQVRSPLLATDDRVGQTLV
jgi:hypothetical protein